MRAGVRLGVDVGSVRVGVAACDPAGVIATPVTTIVRSKGGPSDIDPATLTALAELAAERNVLEIVVGLPTGLSGAAGPAAQTATAFATELAALVSPVDVRLVDERFSTVSAARSLRASGRDTRSGRSVIDQAAAVVILQNALDQERATGVPPGQVVST